MSNKLEAALGALLERIIVLAQEDDDLRDRVRALATAVLEGTERDSVSDEFPQEPAVADESEGRDPHAIKDGIELPALDQPEVVERPSRKLPELTLGQPSQAVEPSPPEYPPLKVKTTDFFVIESRCRLKAEGARWAAARRRLIADGANFYTDIDPKDREIIARAKALPDCFLWMNHPSGPSPSNPNAFDEIAGCFETLADAVALVRQLNDDRDGSGADFESALDLMAEAQSALRLSIAEIDGNPDSDQTEVFHWLKATAAENQIFIQRYMRVDDPADPSKWSELSARIEAVDERLQEVRKKARLRKKLLGKVRHKSSLISNEPNNAIDHWQILAATVHELVDDGMPPSNRDLREILIPVVELLPDFEEVPKGFELALREIDRFMATCSPPETQAATPPTQVVVDAARLLKGRSMILIGGDRRPAAQKALKESLELSELIWIETRDHEPIAKFEPYVARQEVAVVLLAIRWSSHSFGDVSAFCDRHGKPLVRLPGGYSPNQVAAQIMNQCSDRLA